MREILFRGKNRGNNKWVFGSLQVFKGFSIFCNDMKSFITVYSKTIGQYTGMKDINNKRIFEGDIVEFKRVNALGYTTSRIGEVKYYDELPIFYIYANTGDAWDWVDCEEIEVIGNIHDNPELMEGGCD